jgi:hypothetical protein
LATSLPSSDTWKVESRIWPLPSIHTTLGGGDPGIQFHLVRTTHDNVMGFMIVFSFVLTYLYSS